MEQRHYRWSSPTTVAGCLAFPLVAFLTIATAVCVSEYVFNEYYVPEITFLLSAALFAALITPCIQWRTYTLDATSDKLVIKTRTCLLFVRTEVRPVHSIERVYRNEDGEGGGSVMVEFADGTRQCVCHQGITGKWKEVEKRLQGAKTFMPPSHKGGSFCPACGKSLDADQINLAEGVALCPGCGELSRLSQVAGSLSHDANVLERPPRGCWVREREDRIVVHATSRSIGIALVLLGFALFWNGFVAMFLLWGGDAVYTGFFGQPPAWLTSPRLASDTTTLGEGLYVCICMLPFLVVGLAVAGAALMYGFGRVEVVLGAVEGQVRVGVGPFSLRRWFDPAAVAAVRVDSSKGADPKSSAEAIVIEADRTVQFGSLLSDERRDWMRAALQVLLLKLSPGKREQLLVAALDHRS